MSFTNTTLFKKFEIISCYKKDEHSAVYLANHIYLEKKVFLKILNTITIPDKSIIERFKREAKILAKLEHPNIIKIFDFGMYKEYFYISFEYFESNNLRELWNERCLNNNEKKEILGQILQGLSFSHSKNIIHRDIKPENILVNKKNFVKITDFGLSQYSFDSFITKKYAVVGTPAYMSPEQIQGNNLTIKSDLFSLGILAAEMFTGVNPFLGKSSNETINNIISFNENEIDDQLINNENLINKIIKGLLASDPQKRFQSCNEILTILELKKHSSKPKISQNKSHRKYLLYILPAIILILFLIYYYNSYRSFNIKSAFIKKTHVDTVIQEKKVLIDSLPLHTKVDSTGQNRIKSHKASKNIHKKEIKSFNENEKFDFGEVYVKCYPWAKIFINDVFKETTPLNKNININSGKYLLTLTHPDYPNYSDSITVFSNKITSVEVNLDTLFAYLECNVYPWSEVYVDGKKMGTTPLLSPLRISEGSHLLTLKNPEYEDIVQNIKAYRNDTLTLEINMGINN